MATLEEQRNEETWQKAVHTLSSMCISESIGDGPTKPAFIKTLRLYADEMEKLIPKDEPMEFPQ